MKENVESDDKVDMKEYEKTEKILNAHATAISRILGLAANFGQEGRVTESVVVLNSQPPDLYGLRKDHKVLEIEEKHSEDVRDRIEDTMNSANSLQNEINENGSEMELVNNPEAQVGGKSNPNRVQTKPKISDHGYDDLENNPSSSEDIRDAEKMKAKKKGPKLRPVVGANKASSRPTSHILSKVIYKVIEILGKKIRTSCESTEEMMFEIEEVNKKLDENDDI